MSKHYEAPKLTVIGSVESVTAGGFAGEGLDAEFPRKTPKADLRFS